MVAKLVDLRLHSFRWTSKLFLLAALSCSSSLLSQTSQAADQSSNCPFNRSVLGSDRPVGDFNSKSAERTVQIFSDHDFRTVPKFIKSELPKGNIPASFNIVDLPYGERELEKMIEARPAMGRQIKKGDKLWLWLAARLAGGAIGQKISIVDFANLPYGSVSQYHVDSDSAVIRLRSKDQNGNVINPQRLWPAVIFETFNMTHDAEQKAMYAAVIDGKLTREQFIEGSTRAEYKAVKETADFYRDFYFPYVSENSFRASPREWFVEAPDTYEAWIKQYTYKQGYPFDSYGVYYDEKIAPYLKRKAEASGSAQDNPTTPISIGVKFDEQSAGAYLGAAKSSRNWHRVPAWCVGTWKVDKGTSRPIAGWCRQCIQRCL